MTVQFNPSIGSIRPQPGVDKAQGAAGAAGGDFGKALTDSISKINQEQSDSNMSIANLLSGKEQDVNAVIASMARADMSFKLLVGVRNKLVEAYKETMRMQV